MAIHCFIAISCWQNILISSWYLIRSRLLDGILMALHLGWTFALLVINYIKIMHYWMEPSQRYLPGIWYDKGTVHDDVIKWKHFPHYWPFVRGIHRWPMNSPHKGQRRGALVFSLICAWINAWANNREAVDLRRHRAHYDVTVMYCVYPYLWYNCFVS